MNKCIKLINIAQIDFFTFYQKNYMRQFVYYFHVSLVIQKKCMNLALIIYIDLHKSKNIIISFIFKRVALTLLHP